MFKLSSEKDRNSSIYIKYTDTFKKLLIYSTFLNMIVESS